MTSPWGRPDLIETKELLEVVMSEHQFDHSVESPAWYCLRSKPKSEHLAAAHLRRHGGLDVFCPRVAFHRNTRRGRVLFKEAMFPGYLFVRFDLSTQRRYVVHAPSVAGLVHFGEQVPMIGPQLIEQLREEMGPEEFRLLETTLEPGDVVEISGGALRGFEAVVHWYMPARQRVQVLLEILGRQTLVEMGSQDVTRAEVA